MLLFSIHIDVKIFIFIGQHYFDILRDELHWVSKKTYFITDVHLETGFLCLTYF